MKTTKRERDANGKRKDFMIHPALPSVTGLSSGAGSGMVIVIGSSSGVSVVGLLICVSVSFSFGVPVFGVTVCESEETSSGVVVVGWIMSDSLVSVVKDATKKDRAFLIG